MTPKRKKSRARPVGYYLQERRRILFDDVYIVLTLDFLISKEIKNKHNSLCVPTSSLTLFLKKVLSVGIWVWNSPYRAFENAVVF